MEEYVMRSTLAVRLRNKRREKGLSAEALSKKSDVAASSIRKYEMGIVVPSVLAVMYLAEVLEVTIDWLVGRDDYNKEGTT